MSASVASSARPRLALTLGDPAGIGPEIVLKALADRELRALADIVVVGDRAILNSTYHSLRSIANASLADPASLAVIDCPTVSAIAVGTGNADSGAASFSYLETAIQNALAGRIDAIVTAPIAKYAWAAAGHHFPGQTEVLAQHSQTDRYAMTFVARSPLTQWRMVVILATTHIPLRQVPDALDADLVRWKFDLLRQMLQTDLGISSPRIAVSGLNPHSGEAGQLGREEVDWLSDVVASLPNAVGPVPPDTLWVQAGQAWRDRDRRAADGFLALYHDQGLIPLKLLAFDRAVNCTLGLPFVRTSPDHGTAFDIAGRGIADPLSLKEAIALAADLAVCRQTRS
ncbi:MAG: 4-hydroxythreonine-4-phosphate dehydrogenase PdxA, partial [Cyanobacteria bacterium J06648_11]